MEKEKVFKITNPYERLEPIEESTNRRARRKKLKQQKKKL
jgi:hypothetical protein